MLRLIGICIEANECHEIEQRKCAGFSWPSFKENYSPLKDHTKRVHRTEENVENKEHRI